MHSTTTPEAAALERNIYFAPKKADQYRIVQYPDKSVKSGLVFFADKLVKKRFLWIFPYTKWETVKFSNGESVHWHDFDQCTKDVAKLKKGEKIYR